MCESIYSSYRHLSINHSSQEKSSLLFLMLYMQSQLLITFFKSLFDKVHKYHFSSLSSIVLQTKFTSHTIMQSYSSLPFVESPHISIKLHILYNLDSKYYIKYKQKDKKENKKTRR